MQREGTAGQEQAYFAGATSMARLSSSERVRSIFTLSLRSAHADDTAASAAGAAYLLYGGLGQ